MKKRDTILSEYYNQKLSKQKTVERSLLPNLEFGGNNEYAFRKRKFEKTEPEVRIDPKLKFFNGGFLMPAEKGGESFAGVYGKRNYNQDVLSNFKPGGFATTNTTTIPQNSNATTFENIPGIGRVGILPEVNVSGPKRQDRNIFSYINPWNWGVDDYSKYTFSGAYERAKKAGEKEFMWGNKRFTTDYGGTDAQEMDQYGITSAQRTYNPSQLRLNLGNLNTSEGYGTPFKDIVKTAVTGKEIVSEDTPKFFHGGKDIEQDAFRLYLGLPQNNKSFTPSKYKKGAFDIINYDQEFPEIISEEDFNNTIAKRGRPEKENKYGKHIEGQGNVFKPWGDMVMGKHTVTQGSDDQGRYVQYYDKWDLDSYKINRDKILKKTNLDKIRLGEYAKKYIPSNIPLGDLPDKFNKPFEISGRVYYQPLPGTNMLVRKDAMSRYKKDGGDISLPNVYPNQMVPKMANGGQPQKFDLGGFRLTTTTTLPPDMTTGRITNKAGAVGMQRFTVGEPTYTKEEREKYVAELDKKGAFDLMRPYYDDYFRYVQNAVDDDGSINKFKLFTGEARAKLAHPELWFKRKQALPSDITYSQENPYDLSRIYEKFHEDGDRLASIYPNMYIPPKEKKQRRVKSSNNNTSERYWDNPEVLDQINLPLAKIEARLRELQPPTKGVIKPPAIPNLSSSNKPNLSNSNEMTRMVEYYDPNIPGGVNNGWHRKLFPTMQEADEFMKTQPVIGPSMTNRAITSDEDRREFKRGGQLKKFFPGGSAGFNLTSTTTLPPNNFYIPTESQIKEGGWEQDEKGNWIKAGQEVFINPDDLPYDQRKDLWVKRHMNKPWPSFYQTPSNLDWNINDPSGMSLMQGPKFTPEGVEIESVNPSKEELEKYFDDVYLYGGKDELPVYNRKEKEFQCPPDENGRLRINVDGNCVYYDELKTNVFQTNKKGAFTTSWDRASTQFANKENLPLTLGPDVVVPYGAESVYGNSPYYKNVEFKRPMAEANVSQTNPETGDPVEQELNKTLQYIQKNGLRGTGYGDGWLIKPGQYSDWTDDRLRNAVQGITQRSPGYTSDQDWKDYAGNLPKLYNEGNAFNRFMNTTAFGTNYTTESGATNQGNAVTNFLKDVAVGTMGDVATAGRLSSNLISPSSQVTNTYGESINTPSSILYEQSDKRNRPVGALGFSNIPTAIQAGKDLITSGQNLFNNPLNPYSYGNFGLNLVNVPFQAMLSTPYIGGSTKVATSPLWKRALTQPVRTFTQPLTQAVKGTVGSYAGKTVPGMIKTAAGTPLRFVQHGYWHPASQLTGAPFRALGAGFATSPVGFRLGENVWERATGTSPFAFLPDPIPERVHTAGEEKLVEEQPVVTQAPKTTATQTVTTNQKPAEYKPVVVPQKIEFPSAYREGRDTSYTINMGGRNYSIDSRTPSGKEIINYITDPQYGDFRINPDFYDFKNKRFKLLNTDPVLQNIFETYLNENK
jgi:hypothetical protein